MGRFIVINNHLFYNCDKIELIKNAYYDYNKHIYFSKHVIKYNYFTIVIANKYTVSYFNDPYYLCTLLYFKYYPSHCTISYMINHKDVNYYSCNPNHTYYCVKCDIYNCGEIYQSFNNAIKKMNYII